jgi:hypothetical protein
VFSVFFSSIKLTVDLTRIACGEYVRLDLPGKRLIEARKAALRGVAVGGV